MIIAESPLPGLQQGAVTIVLPVRPIELRSGWGLEHEHSGSVAGLTLAAVHR